METIIKKAIEGGYDDTNYLYYKDGEVIGCDERDVVLQSLFWQALQKSCKWEKVRFPPQAAYSDKAWLLHAQNFNFINLTKGWDAAVLYLTNLTGN